MYKIFFNIIKYKNTDKIWIKNLKLSSKKKISDLTIRNI